MGYVTATDFKCRYLKMSGELNMVTKKTTTKAPVKKAPAKKAPAKKAVPAIKAAPKKTTKPKVEKVVKETKPRAKKVYDSPKAEATAKKQPWVGVLETHVNPENPSNGFFELDWNEYFIVQLKSHGYDGPSEESIVDAWFQNLCRNIGNESGVDMTQRSGYINVQKLDNNRSEVS